MAKSKTKAAKLKSDPINTDDVVVADIEETTDVVDTGDVDSPWYYFFSTGCGFCKRVEPLVDELIEAGNDILKLDMAEPDNQKLSRELQTEYKVQCGTPWFINADTGHQICGFREKDIVEKWVKGEEIPAPPRPKSPPPPPPQDFENTDQVNEWKEKYSRMDSLIRE